MHVIYLLLAFEFYFNELGRVTLFAKNGRSSGPYDVFLIGIDRRFDRMAGGRVGG